ncbi:MAG: hypothetical protein JXB00_06950 [Bacteroidales bacterium]|nr:hypothetical protein [Bacteroidales bacterium]
MKRTCFLIIYPFILAVVYLTLLISCDKDDDSNNENNNDNDWNLEMILPVGSTGNSPDVVIDNLGQPHISFLDTDDGYVKYAHKSGTSWNIENVGYYGTSTRGAGLNSIDIDAGNHPHISYYDFNNSELKYACKNSESWTTITIPMPKDPLDISGDTYYSHTNENSIIVDKNAGVTHISFLMWGNYSGYSLGYWNSDLDHSLIVDGSDGRQNAIALDNNGNPGISYYNNTTNSINYAGWNGSSFDIEVISSMNTINWEFQLTSLAYDSDNHPHIAFYGAENDGGDIYKYAYKKSPTWTIISTDYTSGYPSVALCLDSGGKPHIALQASMGSMKYNLVHTYYNGSTWENTKVDENTTDIDNCSITCNNDIVAIVYETDEGAMKYATKSLNK